MKRISLRIFALLLPAVAAGEGVSAIKTASGVMVAWDVPELRFTLEIPGTKIEPLEHPRHFFSKSMMFPSKCRPSPSPISMASRSKSHPRG